jgi:hypothetical protein
MKEGCLSDLAHTLYNLQAMVYQFCFSTKSFHDVIINLICHVKEHEARAVKKGELGLYVYLSPYHPHRDVPDVS